MQFHFEHHSVNTGDLTVPGVNSQDPTAMGLPINRNGIEGLDPTTGFTPWYDILCIKVDHTRAEWILKDPKGCPCGAKPNSFNPNCVMCDKFGTKPGKVIPIDHPFEDKGCINWYLHLENITMLWARQSGSKGQTSAKVPVFELDIPRVIFKGVTVRANARPESFLTPGATIERNFAYHDEWRLDKLRLQLEASNMGHLLSKVPESTSIIKEREYGRYDSVFS